ncbi:hypothetical protein BpHYR1_026916, partial [Brachionus plicatilis]
FWAILIKSLATNQPCFFCRSNLDEILDDLKHLKKKKPTTKKLKHVPTMTNNINDSVHVDEMSHEGAQCTQSSQQPSTPNKEAKLKEKEDRIRILRERQ